MDLAKKKFKKDEKIVSFIVAKHQAVPFDDFFFDKKNILDCDFANLSFSLKKLPSKTCWDIPYLTYCDFRASHRISWTRSSLHF